jgi:nicotinate-nucleotide--dimethylbenzimidazole phosphoribosyltransferase
MIASVHDAALAARVRHALDRKTKPTGALGRLETLALQVALIQGRELPRLETPQLVVFAADHGIAAHGVSAYPAEVTRQMVRNILDGGAAVSVLARQHALALTVVDCGVRHDFAPQSRLVVAKVAHGSDDVTHGPAMTSTQRDAAMAHGDRIAAALPGNGLLLGEMGIGNTSAASLLMARLTGRPLAQCVGRGTGLDDAGLARKQEVLARALAANTGAQAPLDALAALGGLEIATMTGAVLRAASERRVVVVDGFIATAAVAVAAALAPAVIERCIFAHASAESGHAAWLADLGATPLLDLGMRLGEGSGAALAWPLVESACRLLAEMASFESAGVSDRDAS